MAKQSGKRKRRQFTPDFKAEAVRLCKVGDCGVRQVARDVDLTETGLRERVRRAEVEAGKGPPDALAAAESHRRVVTTMARSIGIEVGTTGDPSHSPGHLVAPQSWITESVALYS